MKRKTKLYAGFYFYKILPLCVSVAVLTLLVFAVLRRLSLINYLNTLFVEAAVALILAGIFSILSFYNLTYYKYYPSSNLSKSSLRQTQKNLIDKDTKDKNINERVNTSEVRLEVSVIFIIIGATLLVLLFIIHFASKLFL
ncbi:MAG: hypothetical protein ACP5SB_00440 [Caldisericaceae bacterium]